MVTLVYDLLLSTFFAHSKVPEISESKAPHLFPGVSISKKDAYEEDFVMVKLRKENVYSK